MFELKKIGIVRRASAWLLDAILLAVLITGFMWIISLICNFGEAQSLGREYRDAWDDFRKEYIATGVAEYYGFTYEETESGYTITKDGQPATLNAVASALIASEGKDEQTKAAYDAYIELVAFAPPEKVDRQTEYVYTMLFMMVSVGTLLGYLILEFIVPVILKNGQTIGKKVFGICLVRPNCVRVTTIAVFARMLLGKYAVETMFPVLLIFLFFVGGGGILAIVLFAALLLLNIILFFATKNRTPIHDIFAYTVAADMRMQMIFGSDDELAEKKALAKKEKIEQEKSV